MSNPILKIYSTLDSEQIKFVESKKIENTLKMKRWLEFLQPIAQMDKLNDRSRKSKSTGMIFIIIGMVISLFIGFAFPPFFIALLILTILLIIQIKKLNTLKKLDIGNHLRLFLMPFLVVLKEESSDDAKAKIIFDASPSTSPNKLVKTTSNNNSGYPKIKTSLYNHPWLDAEMMLADGTAIKFDFTDFVARKDITKRGSSGKIKSKVKIKIKHNLGIKISFRKDRYQFINKNGEFIYSDINEFHQFKSKCKTISYSLDESIVFNDVLGLISRAYQNVKAI
jgi:hypothetical protein